MVSFRLCFLKLSSSVLFLCAGLGVVGLCASEISRERAAQIIDESISQELRKGFELAVDQKDYAAIASLYAVMEETTRIHIGPLLAALAQDEQKKLLIDAQNEFMHNCDRYIWNHCLVVDLYNLKNSIPENQHAFRTRINRMYNQKFEASFPTQNGIRGITRTGICHGQEYCMTIPIDRVTAEDIKQEKQLIARRKRYRTITIVSSVLALAGAVSGLLWYWWNN